MPPEAERWLRSLFNDNILAVSGGGANQNAAFAEYGKKLFFDAIMKQRSALMNGIKKDNSVKTGAELLNPLKPVHG